jgi:hypothetical protein
MRIAENEDAVEKHTRRDQSERGREEGRERAFFLSRIFHPSIYNNNNLFKIYFYNYFYIFSSHTHTQK